MNKIEIFDPAMCCETGVCGPNIDPTLPRFAADIEWLKSHGIAVERFNLVQEPAVFVARGEVKDALAAEGNACLPLILVNGKIASRGAYPLREELAQLTGAGLNAASGNFAQIPRTGRSIPVLQTKAQNCCDPGDGNSFCC